MLGVPLEINLLPPCPNPLSFVQYFEYECGCSFVVVSKASEISRHAVKRTRHTR